MTLQPVHVTNDLFPVAKLQVIDLFEANECLTAWEHQMGPITRPPEYGVWCHALVKDGSAIAVATTSTLIRTHVGGGLQHLTRESTIELSRLCACRPGLNRAMLRLWREFIFPVLGYPVAISYQDAAAHRGDIYRFDGWARSTERSRSGTDQRTGAVGRDKWIWVYPPEAAVVAQ